MTTYNVVLPRVPFGQTQLPLWIGRSQFRPIPTFIATNTGFFLTPAAEKTKTQEKNSSQKLKEKTQPLGGFSLQDRKLKKKTKISS